MFISHTARADGAGREAARAPAGLGALVRLLGFTSRGTSSHGRDQNKGRTSSEALEGSAPAGFAVGFRERERERAESWKLLKQMGGGSGQVSPVHLGDVLGLF